MKIELQELKPEDELVQGSVLVGRATIYTDDGAVYTSIVLRTPHGDMAIYLDKTRRVFRAIPCS